MAIADRRVCLITTTISKNEAVYYNKIGSQRFFFGIFNTFFKTFIFDSDIYEVLIPARHIPSTRFCSLLLQTDKFFLSQAGTHEGAVALYLSVICQLQVTALLSEKQNGAAIPLSWFQYRVKQISLHHC